MSGLNIALDATIANRTRTGTGQYAANLSTALSWSGSSHKFFIFCRNEMKDWFVKKCNNASSEVVGVNIRSPKERIIWEQSRFVLELKRRNIDLVHSMAFTLPLLSSMKRVLTVHDLTFHLYASTISLGRRLYYKVFFQNSMKRADQVIAVSYSVRNQLLDEFNLEPEKVHAIHEAPNEEFLIYKKRDANMKMLRQYEITKPYILTVGTIEPRKNLSTLIESFLQLKAESKIPHTLVVAGKQGWAKFCQNNKDIIFTGYFPHQLMPALYSNADIFVFPSVYEGFGLPLLEAFACEVPVIASNIQAHKEICGTAVMLVEPLESEMWTNAMREVLESSRIRKKLVDSGSKRVKKFSWQMAAKQTLKVYGVN